MVCSCAPIFKFFSVRHNRQGRPVNVEHDARCVMGKVGGRQKTQRGGF